MTTRSITLIAMLSIGTESLYAVEVQHLPAGGNVFNFSHTHNNSSSISTRNTHTMSYQATHQSPASSYLPSWPQGIGITLTGVAVTYGVLKLLYRFGMLSFIAQSIYGETLSELYEVL